MGALASFFVLAFAITWSLQALVISNLAGPAILLVLGVAGCGPALAGGWLLRRQGGVAALVRGDGRGRPAAIWFAAALLAPLAVRVVARALGDATGEVPDGTPWLQVPFWGALLLPPLGEELGWRGFAQPRLEARYGTLGGVLVLAALWALWHLPTALYPGAALRDYPAYAAAVVAAGIFVGWLRHASGSVWVAVVAHVGLNLQLVAGVPATYALAGWGALALFAMLALARSPRVVAGPGDPRLRRPQARHGPGLIRE